MDTTPAVRRRHDGSLPDLPVVRGHVRSRDHDGRRRREADPRRPRRRVLAAGSSARRARRSSSSRRIPTGCARRSCVATASSSRRRGTRPGTAVAERPGPGSRRAAERNAVAVYLGNPNSHTLAGGLYVRPLLKASGTRNVFSASTVDQMPKHVSSGLLFGNPNADSGARPRSHRLPADAGRQPLRVERQPVHRARLPGPARGDPRARAASGRGGDPRRTRTAEAADEHVAIRPGTDALVARRAGARDPRRPGGPTSARSRGLVDGFERLAADAATRSRPKRSRAGRVSRRKSTRRIASELAGAPSAAVYGRIGTHTVRFGTVASWLVDVLNVITGNLDRPGGAMFPGPPTIGVPTAGPRADAAFAPGGGRAGSRAGPRCEASSRRACWPRRSRRPGDEPDPRARDRRPATRFVRSRTANDSTPRSASLDFMVSIDIYVNETTRHADVILPPPAPLEKAHYDLAFTGSVGAERRELLARDHRDGRARRNGRSTRASRSWPAAPTRPRRPRRSPTCWPTRSSRSAGPGRRRGSTAGADAR